MCFLRGIVTLFKYIFYLSKKDQPRKKILCLFFLISFFAFSTTSAYAQDTDLDGVADISDVDDDDDGILDIQECPFERHSEIAYNINQSSTTITLNPNSDSFAIDVLRIDNSFNFSLNGTQVTTAEIQYYSVSNNIQFQDGTKYGAGGISQVWSMGGAADSETPLLRVIVNSNGTVEFYGSKVLNGPLLPMELIGGTTINSYTYNSMADNTIILDQFIDGATYMQGSVFGIIPGVCDDDDDTIPNRLDLDSDNDGIPDNIEAQTTAGYVGPSGVDTDNDGLDDAYDTDCTGANCSGVIGISIVPVNTDSSLPVSDDFPDFLDRDSDGDGLFDIDESGDGLTDTNEDGKTDGVVGTNGLDDTVDNDGADIEGDGFDASDDYVDANGKFDNTQTDNFDDTVAGGDVDYREALDTDNDGVYDSVDIDDDNDGILDTDECDFDPKYSEATFSTSNGVDVSLPLDPLAKVFYININRLDNSFNINLNGTQVTTDEIDYNGPTHTIQFQDGTKYGSDGIPPIWTMGTADIETPLIRVIVLKNGTVEFYGSKVLNGPLFPMELTNGNSINSYSFNSMTSNTVILDQNLNGATYIEGEFYGIGDCDSDGDGIPNPLDLDSDNDGIPDNIEAQTTLGYAGPSGVDTDNDGLDDAYDADCTPCGAIIGTSVTPVNTDSIFPNSDTIPDFLDLDNDGDGLFDIDESGDGIVDGNNDGRTDGTVGNNGLDNTVDNGGADNYVDVNGKFDDTQTDNFTDTDDGDSLGGGDLDYRDITIDGNLSITQIYQDTTTSEFWIEVTNSSSVNGVTNDFIITLFKDKTGDQTGISPDAFLAVTTDLTVGQSILISNSGNIITNTNIAAATISDDNVTALTGTNHIIILSKTNDISSWANRFDNVETTSENISLVKVDEILEPNRTFSATDWTVFVDDALDAFANPPERHIHDPLLSEINSATSQMNIQLGLHRFGTTTRSSSAWSNGTPDRSRFVIIDEDYNHTTDKLSARKLTVNVSTTLSLTEQLLVVTNSIDLNGDIRLVDNTNNSNAQLIQTHTASTMVSGSGRLLIDQNSTVPSLYRYNYMSSPVTTIGNSSYTIADVFKDGTTATNTTGIIGTDIAKDITFLSGNNYNGDTTDPITLADYWMYTYASNGSGGSGWLQTRSTTAIASTDGFIFKGPGRAQNYTFLGTPKDGDLTTSIGSDESYLVGNPYASALSVKRFIEDNLTSTTATLYFWQHVDEDNTSGDTSGHNYGGYIGGYATRTIAMGTAANSSSAYTPYNITLEAESATTTGSINTTDIELNNDGETLTFNNIIKGVEEPLVLNYNSSNSKLIEIFINNISKGTFTLASTSGFENHTITSLGCIIRGSTILIKSLDNIDISIDYIRLEDSDGELNCEPSPQGGTGYLEPEEYIAIGQGFFIGGSSAGGNVVFNNSQREYKTEGTGSSIFFRNNSKSTQENNTNEFNLPILKLGIDFLNEDNIGIHRQIGISFDENNSFDFDKGYDSHMYDIGTTDMYWTSPNDENKYVIAGVGEISSDLEVPFDIIMGYTGSVLINIDTIENIDSELFIIDKLTNKIYSLHDGDITLQLATGTYTNRFVLAFSETVLSDNNNISVSDSKNVLVHLDRDNKELVIKNYTNEKIEKVEIFNLLGQKLYQWNTIENIFKNRLKTRTLSQNFYIINVYTKKGRVSKKVHPFKR